MRGGRKKPRRLEKRQDAEKATPGAAEATEESDAGRAGGRRRRLFIFFLIFPSKRRRFGFGRFDLHFRSASL